MNASSKKSIALVKRAYTIERPEGFFLRFDYERNCTSMQHGKHRARFKKVRGESPVYFSVDELAASAALRHYGSGYSDPLLAAAKEDVLWAGWLGVRTDGRLIVELNTTGHSERLREFSGSMGEAIMLALLERLFAQPLALWRRIPETSKGAPTGAKTSKTSKKKTSKKKAKKTKKKSSTSEAMDFAVTTATGGIAVEAKARKDWRLTAARDEIVEQMTRQAATEKYGFVLLYQQRGTKRRRSSIVHVIDPPGDNISSGDPLRAMQEHYYQLSWGIGIWPLAYVLGERLGLKKPDTSPTQLEYYERVRREPQHLRLNALRVRGRRFVGRFFDTAALTGEDRAAAARERTPPLPYFFYGIDEQVVAWLLSGTDEDLKALRAYAEQTGPFSFRREGTLGPLRYAGLSDGVLRVDLADCRQLTDENLDVE